MTNTILIKEFLETVVKSMSAQTFEQDHALRNTGKVQFDKIKEKGIEQELFTFLKNDYANEMTIYIDLMLYLYYMLDEVDFLLEYEKAWLEKELQGEDDLFVEICLEDQIWSNEFRNNKEREFDKVWERNEKLLKKMQEKLQIEYDIVPTQQRNDELVVLVVSQLLSVAHAPSKLVLEFAYAIQKYLKKRVLILNTSIQADYEGLQKRGVPNIPLYLYNNWKEGNKRFDIEYKGEVFATWQVMIERNNVAEMKKIIEDVYQLKPLCVWNFGAIDAYAGVMKQFTTYIYMFLTQGYPPVWADILVNYIKSERPQDLENEKFLKENGVQIKKIGFLFPYDKPIGKISRSEWGIPDDAFCIGVIGNRLENECSDKFYDVISQVVQNADIYVIFIGKNTETLPDLAIKNASMQNKYRFTGYVDELMEYLTLIDLFVDPPRRGGGNGAAMAMSIGKPVITLAEGDVATVAGDKFIVNSLDQFAETIVRYKNDENFYKEQSKSAIERINEQTTSEEELADLIGQVLTLAEEKK